MDSFRTNRSIDALMHEIADIFVSVRSQETYRHPFSIVLLNRKVAIRIDSSRLIANVGLEVDDPWFVRASTSTILISSPRSPSPTPAS